MREVRSAASATSSNSQNTSSDESLATQNMSATTPDTASSTASATTSAAASMKTSAAMSAKTQAKTETNTSSKTLKKTPRIASSNPNGQRAEGQLRWYELMDEPTHSSKPRSSTLPRLPRGGSQPGESRHHVYAIDGLRAIAIIGVVLYHTRPSLLQGGFLGVTLFFVISGFFITRSVLRGHANREFNYFKYIVNRLRRLWPPILSVIALTTLLSYLFSPALLPKEQPDALPSALFYSNWSFIFRHLSYFQSAGLPSPLTHLWYTSLIMQFFVLWPLLLACIAGKWTEKTSRMIAVGALIACSTVEMAVLHLLGADTSRLYYGLDTRCAELLMGALLAVIMVDRPGSQRKNTQLNAIGMSKVTQMPPEGGVERVMFHVRNVTSQPWVQTVIGAVILVALCVGFVIVDGEASWLYLCGFLLVAAACALLVWVAFQQNLLSTILGCKPLQYLGSRSFSLYLVHYPLLEIMNPATRIHNPSWWQWLLQMLLIVLVAEAFYQLVEALRGTPLLPWLPANYLTDRMNAAKVSAANTTEEDVPNTIHPSKLSAFNEARVHAFNAVKEQAARHGFHMRLRPAALICAIVGVIITVTMATMPGSWQDISTKRAVQLRPELAQTTASKTKTDSPTASPSPSTQASPDASASASAESSASSSPDADASSTPKPQALVVPDNLDPASLGCDHDAGVCQARVLIIGDSVTVAAQDALQQRFPNALIDAAVSRHFWSASDIYRADIQNYDPQVVLVTLNINSTVTQQMLDQLHDLVGDKPLYLLTGRAPVDWVEGNNALLTQYAKDHSNVGIIDWSGLSAEHPEYLSDDGTHPTPDGAEAFATLVYQAFCGS